MDLPENEDVQLTEQNFRNVCRLCLQADDEFVNVFDRIEQNPLKQPLAERVYDLYQIKVSEHNELNSEERMQKWWKANLLAKRKRTIVFFVCSE